MTEPELHPRGGRSGSDPIVVQGEHRYEDPVPVDWSRGTGLRGRVLDGLMAGAMMFS